MNSRSTTVITIAALAIAFSAMARAATSPERVIEDYKAFPSPQCRPNLASGQRAADGWLAVRTQKGPGRAGVVLQPPDKSTWDLSAHAEVAVPIRNLGAEDLRVTLRLDDDKTTELPTGKHRGGYMELVVSPGTDPMWLIVPLGDDRPSPLADKYLSMVAKPTEFVRRGVVKSARITRISIFSPDPASEVSFAIGPVVARGVPAPLRDAPESRAFPIVDEYGQYLHRDWPGKIRNDADFTDRRRAEEADLAANPRPAHWNRFGGFADGPTLQATGFFRVEKRDHVWWMIDPEGKLFWSHGVVRVGTRIRVGSVYHGTPLPDREHFLRLPPKDSPLAAFFGVQPQSTRGYYLGRDNHPVYDYLEANLFRKYGDQWRSAYADQSQKRLASWGLNSIANSSDPVIYTQRKTPYTAIVYSAPLGKSEFRIQGSQGNWGKLPDPFDPGWRELMDRTLKAELKDSIHDPWCLGFFVDNELHWGDTTHLAEVTFASPAQQHAKRHLAAWLAKKYDTIAALNSAWGTSHASWDALLAHLQPPDRKRPAARADLEAMSAMVIDAYFRGCREAVKAAAPNHMYLGSRFAGAGNVMVMRAAAKYCDIVSINAYSRSIADLALPEGLDRPIVIGEFHFDSMDAPMHPAGLVLVANHADRARAYRTYVRSALRNPAVVGTHWFQFYDQPTTGRFDGENYQTGLLDIADTPYSQTIAACRDMGRVLYQVRSKLAPATRASTPAAPPASSAGSREHPGITAMQLAGPKATLTLDARGLGLAPRDPAIPGSTAAGAPLWTMVLQSTATPPARHTLVAQDHAAQVDASDDRIRLSYARVTDGKQTWPIKLTLEIRRQGDGFEITADVQNDAEGWVVANWTGPALAGIPGDLASHPLLWPVGLGQRINVAPASPTAGKGAKPAASPRAAGWRPIGDNAAELALSYPGSTGTMQWCAVAGPQGGLYVGSHDPRHGAKVLTASYDIPQARLALGITHQPLCPRGQRWASPPLSILPYSGSWHVAARHYRAWFDSAASLRDIPDWVKQSSGWLLCILKQQNDSVMWDYPSLSKLLDVADARGLDILGLFGWAHGGHDRLYPDYLPDPKMGGADPLKRALAEARRRGKRTILYANGQLIDANTDFYRDRGKATALQLDDGAPWGQNWQKFRSFPAVRCVLACQSAPAWQQRMRDLAIQAHELGADGILFDQLGMTGPRACYSAEHGHPVPAMAYAADRAAWMRRVADDMRRRSPEFIVMTEGLHDSVLDSIAMFHGCVLGEFTPTAPEIAARIAQNAPNAPFPEMFRFTFPEVISTQRHPTPMLSPLAANYACIYGLRFEIESRYAPDVRYLQEDVVPAPADYSDVLSPPSVAMMQATPPAQATRYLRQLVDFQRRHAAILWNGRYTDDTDLVFKGPGLLAKGYATKTQLGVLVWNPTDQPAKFSLDVPGGRLMQAAEPGRDNVDATSDLPPQSIRLLIWQRP